MSKPNFFVIGAPKAGTTALYWYLAEHPEIFMSPIKETNFLAYARDEAGELCYGDPVLHHFPVTTAEDYARLFAGAEAYSARGEASPIYLECPFSADRIQELDSDARIICGLRNPIDRAYSDYLMYLRTTRREFDEQRDLSETARWMHPDSHWMRNSRYYETLSRFYARFPAENIHVFLFDELKRSPLAVAQGVYRFLGVNDQYQPDLGTPYNVGGVPANMLLERLFSRTRMRDLVEPLLPRSAINWARRMRTRNMKKPPALPVETRKKLGAVFLKDIERTSRLVGQDLSHWLEEGAGVHRQERRSLAFETASLVENKNIVKTIR